MPRTPRSGWPGASRVQEISAPRLCFLTVRLLELAALFAAVSAVMQVWLMWGYTLQSFGPTGEPTGDGPPFLDRLVLLGGIGFAGVATFGVLLGCVCLLGALVVLHAAQPVAHGGILRWELAGVAGVLTMVTVSFLVPPALGIVRGDPNAPADGVVSYGPGPGFGAQQLAQLPVPLACAVLLSVVWLWWLRLTEEDDGVDVEDGGGAADDLRAGDSGQHPEPTSAGQPRRPRAAAADADDLEPIVVDEVEQIAPVERLTPREDRSDGSTASGYDDYFRRF